MTIINLDREFTPFGQGINFQSTVFPSGFEVNVRLPKITGKVLITTRIKEPNDIMRVVITAGALRNMRPMPEVSVFMPYLPYARQDRAMIEEGEVDDETEPYQEATSVKDFAQFMNLQSFKNFIVLDPHSEIGTTVLDGVMKVSNHNLVKKVLGERIAAGDTKFRIACPDAGAEKKVIKLCKSIGYTNDLLMCEKVRDVRTGKLVSIKIHADDLQGMDIYTVDDICDGGGTYIMQGLELQKKNAGNRFLIVTHALLTQGEEVLKPYVEHIYSTDSMKDRVSDYVTQYKIEHLYGEHFQKMLQSL